MNPYSPKPNWYQAHAPWNGVDVREVQLLFIALFLLAWFVCRPTDPLASALELYWPLALGFVLVLACGYLLVASAWNGGGA